MTPTDILMPVILCLAVYGYVTCLSRHPWLTAPSTGAVVLLVSVSFPFSAANALVWLCAAAGGLLALVTAYVLPKVHRPASRKPCKKAPKDHAEIVIDGTNVLYWDSNEPTLATLRVVVDHLTARGFFPYIFLDASSRHHLNDKSLNAKGFASALGLHQSRVMVCPAGAEADAFILKFAKTENLPIISNDRFSDRLQQAKGLKLVKGVMANGKPILNGL